MATDSFECKIITGGFNHCDSSWNKQKDELDRCFKIYYPTNGEALIKIDEVEISIEPGNIYFISGFNITSQKCVLPMDIYWLHFVPTSLYLRHLLLSTGNIHIWKTSDFLFAHDFKTNIERIFTEERYDFRQSETLIKPYSYEEAMLHAIILNLLAKILEKVPETDQSKSDEILKLEPAVKFMNNEYKNNPSLEEIASKSALAPNYFHRIFKKNFGVTPFNYMQRLRMELAIRLLTTTAKSVKEVAFESGYINEYYFYRQFKNYCGYSPGKLKEMRPF